MERLLNMSWYFPSNIQNSRVNLPCIEVPIQARVQPVSVTCMDMPLFIFTSFFSFSFGHFHFHFHFHYFLPSIVAVVPSDKEVFQEVNVAIYIRSPKSKEPMLSILY